MKKLLLLLPLILILSGFTFPEDKHLVDRNDLEKTQSAIVANFGIKNKWYPFAMNGEVSKRYSIAYSTLDESKGQFVVFVRGDLNAKYTIGQVVIDKVPKQHVKEVLESFGVGYTPSFKDVVKGNTTSADFANDNQYVFLLANKDNTFTVFVMYDETEITKLTE